MLEKEIQDAIISKGRDFMKGYRPEDPNVEKFESDQELKLPQPSLVKAPVTTAEEWIPLTKDFSGLELKNNLTDLFRDRKSSRVYTEEAMTLDELSFLLWSTQGVKSIRGKNYATIRTVPSGGARHEFETYLIVRNVTGLEQGAYHYLPLEHALEFLFPIEQIENTVVETLCGQKWTGKSNVVFYWSVVPYRAEWRYGILAHRTALIDVGHVGQNLYLACTGLGLGCCAVAAFEHERCNQLFGLDGDEEFIVYTVPVGTVRECDKNAEQAFYAYV